MEERNETIAETPETFAAQDPASTPVIPLPNPGEGGPVAELPPSAVVPPTAGGGIQWLPTYPTVTGCASVRFLNASYGYPSFRIYIDGTRVVSVLSSASASGYVRVTSGRHVITAAGPDGYIYLQKDFSFSGGSASTVAIVNRAGGLDMTRISDPCSPGC